MVSTIIYITRHDRHFTLNIFRITAVISESYSVLVNACLISRTAMNYLRICTPPLSQTKVSKRSSLSRSRLVGRLTTQSRSLNKGTPFSAMKLYVVAQLNSSILGQAFKMKD
ncbi:hypothetical protein pdam_00010193, partial [Pocillopora damicornis]